ncbi:CrcB family protein [Streptomyces sp. NPDC002054]|uniref:fluoride efflux transporter FluC n=1 Tax=Streptomyces sp. NPDC002054 TaxID=3154663 RepID=UPI00332793AE
MNWLYVVLGAAVGASLRHLTDRAVRERWAPAFPWGTFAVNVAGSLLLGVVAGAALSGGALALLGPGLCGALTTYSTFSYETLRLAETGRGGLAAAYAGSSVTAGVCAVWLGLRLAELL